MAKRLIAKQLKSELMLYDPVQDAVHVLNATASLIYELCNEGKQPEEIAREMRRRFALSEGEEILKGIQDCLAELQQKGLVAA